MSTPLEYRDRDGGAVDVMTVLIAVLVVVLIVFLVNSM